MTVVSQSQLQFHEAPSKAISVGQAYCSRPGPHHDVLAPQVLVRYCGYPVGAAFNTVDEFHRSSTHVNSAVLSALERSYSKKLQLLVELKARSNEEMWSLCPLLRLHSSKLGMAYLVWMLVLNGLRRVVPIGYERSYVDVGLREP